MSKKYCLLFLWTIVQIPAFAQPTLVTSVAPLSPVDDLQFSKTGRLFLTANAERVVMIWDSKSQKPIHSFTGSYAVEAAAFRPDEKSIITVGADDTVRQWDIEKRKLIWKVHLPIAFTATAAFNPDGTQLAVSGAEGLVVVLDANTGRTMHTLKAVRIDQDFDATFGALVKYSPNGKYLVTEPTLGAAIIWDAMSAKQLHVLANPPETNTGIVFSHDSKYVVTQSVNSILWELATGKKITDLGPFSNSVDFIKGTNKLISSGNGVGHLWEIGKKISDTLKMFAPGVQQVIASPDGKYIVGTNEQGIASVVLTSKPNALYLPEDLPHFKTMVFHPTQNLLYGFCEDALSVAQLNDKNQVTKLNFGTVRRALFSRDGTAIKIYFEDPWGDEYHFETIWNISTGVIMPDEIGSFVFGGGFYSSIGNRRIAVNDEGTDIHLTNKQGKSFTLKKAGFSFLFNHDSTYLVSKWETLFREGYIKYPFERTFVWRIKNGRLLREGLFSSTEFSPDGTRFVTADNEGKITLYETATGKPIISLSFVSPNEWIVTHASGLFDAAPATLDKLYFSEGTRILPLDRSKHEPELWKKVISGRKLRTP